MIAEILIYIPDQLSFGQTCKKFYEISCQNSFFKLSFPIFKKGNNLIGQTKNIEEVFKSMMNSKRRIKFLKLGYQNKNCSSIFEEDSAIKVIKHFASDVTILHLNSVIVNNIFIDVLNLMTNLTSLKVTKVKIKRKLKVSKLKLHRLEKIISSECSTEFLEIFNEIPAGVLKKVELLWYTKEEEKIHRNHKKQVNLFKNQQNIKEIVAHSFLNLIDFRQLKLQSLLYEDYSDFNIQDSLKAQSKLKSLTSYSLNPGDLKFICTELKSLEFLNGNFCKILSSEFSHLHKLKNFKNLRVSWNQGGNFYEKINESLFVMCSETLIDLEINCDKVMNSALIQLGTNCPNIRRLTFDADMPISVIDLFIKHFKNLRCLVFQSRCNQIYPLGTDVDQISLTEMYENKTIEKLSIFSSCTNIQILVNLMKKLKNLRNFKTSLNLNPKIVEEILVSCRRLEKLHLLFEHDLAENNQIISIDLIEIIKSSGKNLSEFYFEFNQHGVLPKSVIEEFEHQFMLIQVRTTAHNIFELEALGRK